MRTTIKRPSRAQVRRALEAWRLIARPPDEMKTPAGEAGAEGKAEGLDASEGAPRPAQYLSAAPFTDRRDECEVMR